MLTDEQVVARLRECNRLQKTAEREAFMELQEAGLTSEGFGLIPSIRSEALTRKEWVTQVELILAKHNIDPRTGDYSPLKK